MLDAGPYPIPSRAVHPGGTCQMDFVVGQCAVMATPHVADDVDVGPTLRGGEVACVSKEPLNIRRHPKQFFLTQCTHSPLTWKPAASRCLVTSAALFGST